MYRSRLAVEEHALRKVVYVCAPPARCGGLGDRFKGFVSTFVLALLLDAEFVICWTGPVRASPKSSYLINLLTGDL